jgi:hypothetical protein
MTRTRHVTPGATAARLENIRNLITTLQQRQLARHEIGAILCVGPSGVRKYLKDLSGKIELVYEAGTQVFRLTMDTAEAQAYLIELAARALARPAKKSATALAVTIPGRHFHILEDDEYCAVRMQRGPVARDWAVAAIFGQTERRSDAATSN